MAKTLVIVDKTHSDDPKLLLAEDGSTLTFKTKEEANKFKKLSGLGTEYEVALI